MKVTKIVQNVASVGGKIAGIGSSVVATADCLIHYKEYQAKKRRNRAIAITLGVIGGILVILFFPYKIKVHKNGDFELRSLMMKVTRKTVPAEIAAPEEKAVVEESAEA